MLLCTLFGKKTDAFTSTDIATTSEGMKELDIGIVECFPEFACVHLGFFLWWRYKKDNATISIWVCKISKPIISEAIQILETFRTCLDLDAIFDKQIKLVLRKPEAAITSQIAEILETPDKKLKTFKKIMKRVLRLMILLSLTSFRKLQKFLRLQTKELENFHTRSGNAVTISNEKVLNWSCMGWTILWILKIKIGLNSKGMQICILDRQLATSI